MREELATWVAVALIAVAANKLFTIAARGRAGDVVPGMRKLADL